MLVVFCVKCGQRLQVSERLAGAKCRCPQCSAVVSIPADAADESTGVSEKPRPAAPSKRPASGPPRLPAKPARKEPVRESRSRDDDDVEDVDDDDSLPKRSRGRRKKTSVPWGIIAIVGGGAMAVALTFVVAGVVWFMRKAPARPQVAVAAPPAVQPNVPPDPQPVQPQPQPKPVVDPKIPQPVPIAGQPLADVLPLNLKTDEAAEFPKPPAIVLKPSALVGDAMELKLTSNVSSVAVGAGGRYLILNQPKEKQLAVFDSEQAKIVKLLPVGGDGTQIAAGHDALIVANPAQGRLERWSLTSFTLESVAPLQPGDSVSSMAMGASSVGPLAVAMRSKNQASLLLLHPQTFKPSALTIENNRNLGPAPLHASADGRTIVEGARIWWRLKQNFQSFKSPENVAPGPEGLTLFGKGQVRLIDGRPLHQNTSAHGRAIWYVPAVQGGLVFLSMNQVTVPGNGGAVPGKRNFLEADFHIFGNLRPIATLEKVNGNEGLVDWWSGKHMPFEQYVFYIPDANLLAILPTSRDKLFLHRVDFDSLRRNEK